MKIKHILVDFDGVIRHWPYDDTEIEERYDLPIGTISETAFSKELLGPAIRGSITDEVWRENICFKLAEKIPMSKANQAIEEWSENVGEINADIVRLLSSYSDVSLSLVTNATSRLPSDLQALGIDSSFANVFNSSDMGTVKPEFEFFYRVLEQLDVSPGETVIVDDTVQNVDAAGHLGINAHQFVNITMLESFLLNHLNRITVSETSKSQGESL
ncbi:MAG: HAD-IA family hydrolase [Granulosicoccus sp.]|nr:HAD-IA family hydrolase [Granulosicoccus sp.]